MGWNKNNFFAPATMEDSRTPQKRLHSIETHFEPSMTEQSDVEKQRAAYKG
jgi:hypothetical protein